MPTEISAGLVPILTLKEAAAYLRCPLSRVRIMVRAGVLPYQQIGKKYVLRQSDIAAYLDARWQTAGGKKVAA